MYRVLVRDGAMVVCVPCALCLMGASVGRSRSRRVSTTSVWHLSCRNTRLQISADNRSQPSIIVSRRMRKLSSRQLLPHIAVGELEAASLGILLSLDAGRAALGREVDHEGAGASALREHLPRLAILVRAI